MKRKPLQYAYWCSACCRVIYREQRKGWIVSYCDRSDRRVRMYLMKRLERTHARTPRR